MISAINIASGHSVDAEYLRIIQELRRFGLTPTGNKGTDKARLEQAKSELVEKIQNKEYEENMKSVQVQPMAPVDEAENAKRSDMEVQRLGAMTVAELNRLYFGL